MKQLNNRFKLNNHGSTLVTVMICIALISILGSLMLSVTLTNLQMKIVESKSKGNFYSCDAAMEEIRTGLQELTAETMKEVYNNKVLTNYAAYVGKSDEDINKEIQNMVIGSLMKKLGDTVLDETQLNDTVHNGSFVINAKLDKFTQYLSNIPGATTQVTVASLASSGNSMVINDVQITYIKDDYQSVIASNIKVNLPDFTFDGGAVPVPDKVEQPFQNYALVADEGIISVNTPGTSDVSGSSVSGNVYAGDQGILIKNTGGIHGITMTGETITSIGDITVADTAHLTINQYTKADGTTVYPLIWAKNLFTSTNSNYSVNTVMDINGICLIQDDLALNGYNSDVHLSGAYVGYTRDATDRSSLGSAVMINGSSSALDLSHLSAFMLAGRANVSITGNTHYNGREILTGESVAFKSNQKAYLVPGKFIYDSAANPIMHNPVTLSDNASVVSIVPEVGDLDYNAYLPASTPTSPPKYIIASKQANEGDVATTLQYYYMNFASGKQADDFLQAYMLKYPGSLDSMLPFTLDYLKLPPAANIKVVGNVMSYSGSGGSVQLLKGLSSAPVYPTDSILDSEFLGFTLDDSAFDGTGLHGKRVGDLPQELDKIDPLVASTMINGGITQIISSTITPSTTDYVFTKSNGNYTVNSLDPAKQYICVVDGTLTIPNNTTISGFLIASGDIVVGDNVTINGIVITTGGNITLGNKVTVNGRLVAKMYITLGTDNTIKADAAAETNIAAIFDKEGTLLSYLFHVLPKDIDLSGASSFELVDLSGMISYENWRKLQ